MTEKQSLQSMVRTNSHNKISKKDYLSIDECRSLCSKTISHMIAETGGKLAHSTKLASTLEQAIPGVESAWLIGSKEGLLSLGPGDPDESPNWISATFQAMETSRGESQRRPFWMENTRSYWSPLSGRDGYLIVIRHRPLSRLEQRCVHEIALAVTTVLELRESLLKRASSLEEDFQRLVEVAGEISRCQNLEDLYAVVADQGQKLLGSDRHNLICLQRFFSYESELECVAASGKGAERFQELRLSTSTKNLRTRFYPRRSGGRPADDFSRQTRLSFTGAMVKDEIHSNIIHDVQTLGDHQPYYCLSEETRSEVAVLIVLSDGTRWGVFNVESPYPNAFSEFFDLPLLMGFARLIAAFIESFERRRKAYTLDDIISLPESLKKVIRLFAQSSESVLITGETGTGKELVARALHYGGSRRNHAFIPINCGAIEPNLMMSELFGYSARAYTGAGTIDRDGLFKAADKGTIFLDEIENMARPVQEALLRVVERGEIRKVGGTSVDIVDVRVIAATNVDLKDCIKKGTFRRDLYYRLKILELNIPPLRERREFIRPLLETFIDQYRRPTQHIHLDSALLEIFQSYDWPGNVRELKNLVKRLLILSDKWTPALLPIEMREGRLGDASQGCEKDSSPQVITDHSSIKAVCHERAEIHAREQKPDASIVNDKIILHLQLDKKGERAFREVEKKLYLLALRSFNGDRYQVARFLGVSPPTVYRKIREWSLVEERFFRSGRDD